MPLYSFYDSVADEVVEHMMKHSDIEGYLKLNPNQVRIIEAPAIVSGVAIQGKTSDGFKDVLSKISEAHPGSPLAERHSSKTIKQARTQHAVNKWKASQK